MLRLRGLDTVRVSLRLRVILMRPWFGGARDLDRLGNNRADEAADFGRRRGCLGGLSMLDVIILGVVLAPGCPRSASVFYCRC